MSHQVAWLIFCLYASTIKSLATTTIMNNNQPLLITIVYNHYLLNKNQPLFLTIKIIRR